MAAKPHTNSSTILNKIVYGKNRQELFHRLPLHVRSFLLPQLSPKTQKLLLSSYTVPEIAAMLDYLDPTQATAVLKHIPTREKQHEVLHTITTEMRRKIEHLLRFDPTTAAALINFNYIVLNTASTLKDAAESISEHEQSTGKPPAIIAVNDTGTIAGELPIGELPLHSQRSRIGAYLKKIHTLPYTTPTEHVLHVFTKSPHSKIVILDEDGSILGIIYSDDALRHLQQEHTTSLYSFAGVREYEGAFDSVFSKVKNRYRWLIVNLATAFLAAGVVGLFSDTINKFVLLAIYMPVIAGMGGNAATQTLAVMVRSIALRKIRLQNSFKAIRNESLAGLVNGVINGVLVALVATFFNQSPLLGLVVSAAMMANLLIAGFFGALIPLILKQLGRDPATSATIFITTATDVFGFFVFLGLAQLILVE